MKTMDYAKLCDKDYKVVLNDAILGILRKMISKIDLDILYKWASTSKFPLKNQMTVGYTNKDIYICGLKYIRKNVNIRKSMMTDAVYNIIKNDNILYAVYSRFAGNYINTTQRP